MSAETHADRGQRRVSPLHQLREELEVSHRTFAFEARSQSEVHVKSTQVTASKYLRRPVPL